MKWFPSKEECVHCHEIETRRRYEDDPTCPQCEINLRKGEEEVRKCPVDGEKMEKEVRGEVVVDCCPECGGIWLDHGELAALQEAAAEGGAFVTGLAVGMIL